MKAKDVRASFLAFFERHGHAVVKSSPLVPQNDPTLMFTNAGMVQFKDVFTGAEKRPYTRAATCQKCLRVSGKHNDLEEVGRTTRHHTFFEMLGNFSFGDYFKEQAIELAWTYATREVGLDPKRMWVTVFEGAPGIPADDEARTLWKKISGLPDERIVALGMKDNFWAMGDSGPCGPCTEIHFDTGTGPVTPEAFQNGRIIEFWNNVFMQFNRQDGVLTPLPKPSVDTGMGLERLCTLLDGADSNYHTDVFLPLLDAIAAAAKKPYRRSAAEDDVSMRVIADHARTTAFLTADGVQPSNEGRGYVMRRVMRRAIRHGKRLGFDDVFFESICDVVVEHMGAAYPELVEARTLIKKVAELEERSFRRTLDTGLKLLDDEIRALGERRVLPGEAVFKLYDTYGFPKDLTEVIAAERGLTLDEAGFERAMSAQQERSRGSEVGSAAVAGIYRELQQRLGATDFVGYTHEDEPIERRQGEWRVREEAGKRLVETHTTVRAMLASGREVAQARAGEAVELVLSPTPFYGESGGQVGDHGVVTADGVVVQIEESVKPLPDFIVSRGRVVSGVLRAGQRVWAGYDAAVRQQTRAHHSATHLLHGSLRRVLGEHVKQAGSLVDPLHLRFDYAHFEAPTPSQMQKVEDDANARVRADDEVRTEVLPFEQAKQKGAIALFGEKYGDLVRVVSMGESVEFCGGTHARRTSDIGMVLVTAEEAVASGVRRIQAEVADAAVSTTRRTHARLTAAAEMLAGRAKPEADKDEPILLAVAKAVRHYQETESALRELGGTPATVDTRQVAAPALPASFGLGEARAVRDLWSAMVQLANARGPEADAVAQSVRAIDTGVARAFAQLTAAARDHDKQLEQKKRSQLTAQSGDLMARARDVGGVRVLATKVSGVDAKALRELADDLRSKMPSGILCLASDADGKAALLITVTKDLTSRFQAGKLVGELAPLIGGRGGGKPELAQAGGTDPGKIEAMFDKLYALVAS